MPVPPVASTNLSGPTAGAATNHGVYYQAIWVVLQALKADDHAEFELEPRGGDILVKRLAGQRRAVQLKTLQKGRWSLLDLIIEVLPDLYRAVDASSADISYEFVTEGGKGDWSEVQTFFAGLQGRWEAAKRNLAAADAALDGTRPLTFGGSKTAKLWQAGTTERDVVGRIVDSLSGADGPAKGESSDLTRTKVWHLLAHFRFDGGHSPAAIRQDIEVLLGHRLAYHERTPNLVAELVGWVVDRSRANSTVVTPVELLAAAGITDQVPATDRSAIARRCRDSLSDALMLRGYQSNWDVRPAIGAAIPITVVTGESGVGKSWMVYAIANKSRSLATVIQETSRDAAIDVQRSADAVWKTAMRYGETVSLDRLAEKLTIAQGTSRGNPWLTLCIDRVAETDIARNLCHTPIEDWGVRLVIGCEQQVVPIFESYRALHPNRLQICTVERFTEDELHNYLSRRLGDGSADVPLGVKDLIRLPQLAGLYCRLATTGVGNVAAASPTSEYGLLDTFWKQINESGIARHEDEFRLRQLAASLTNGRAYPWTVDHWVSVGLDSHGCVRLQRVGWLRESPGSPGYMEVPHDRLLAYAVARSLVRQCSESQWSAPKIWDEITRAVTGSAGSRLFRAGEDWFELALADRQFHRLAVDVAMLVPAGLSWLDIDDLTARLTHELGTLAEPLVLRQATELAAQERS